MEIETTATVLPRVRRRCRSLEARTWLLAGASALALSNAASADTQTGTPGFTSTASTSGVVDFNTPTGTVTRDDTYAVQILGVYDGNPVYDQTFPSDAAHVQAGTGSDFAPASGGVADAQLAIITASGNAPGLFITDATHQGTDSTLLSSTAVSTYSLNSQTNITTAEVVVGPDSTTIGARSDCSSVAALPSTVRPTCVDGTPDTFIVISGEVNTNTNVETTYHIDEVRSGTDTYVTTEHDQVTGILVPAGGSLTGSAGFTTTTSASASLVFNTPTGSITRVDTYSTEIVGQLGSTQVFDQTYNAAFADASVQNGLDDARAAIQAAGHGRAVLIASPVLTSSSTTLASSTGATTYSVASQVVTTSDEVTVGPGSTTFGVRSACTVPIGTTTVMPTCTTGSATTLNVVGGEINTNLNTDTVSTIDTTLSGTDTYLTAERYLIQAVFAAFGRVHPAAQTMALDLSASFLSALTDRGARARTYGDDESRWALFLEGVGQNQDFGTHGDIAGSDGSFRGLRGGATFAASPQWTFGVVGEDGSWHWDSHDRALPEHARDADAWRLGGFASWRDGPWQMTAGAFTGSQHVKSFTDSSAGSALANYHGAVDGIGGKFGYAIALDDFTLTPSVGVDWLHWHADAFDEHGGLAPLSVRAASRDQTRMHIGLALDKKTERWNFGAFVRGTYVDGDRQGRVLASDGVSAAGDFVIDGPATDRRQGEIGAHVDYEVAPGVAVGLAASARGGDESQSYGVQIGLRWTL